MKQSPVFDKTYTEYLKKISDIDLSALAERLGFAVGQKGAVIPLFNKTYYVSSEAIMDADGRQPHLGICVILFKYLLMCPQITPQDNSLCAFKDFKDALPLGHFFSDSVQGKIARHFTGRILELENTCRKTGGMPSSLDVAYQVTFRFQGLPRVPVFLLFNDKEEGFSAQCTLLFRRSAGCYLDMESLAILGGVLAESLVKLSD